MFGLGAAGLLIGVTVLGAHEIERKLKQRRDDPAAFADTPIAWTVAGLLGLLAITYAGARQRSASSLSCTKFKDDLYRCTESR